MASQTIVGPELQYTQDNLRCFAYAKDHGQETTEFNLLSFQTKSGYIVGEFIVNGPTRIDTVDVGGTCAFQIKFNDYIVLRIKVDTNDKDSPSQGFWRCIIPPFTDVEVSANCAENTANETINVTFTGRVYEYLPVRN